MTDTNISTEVLITAADLIEEHGWQQDSYGNSTTGYCAIGALNAAEVRVCGTTQPYSPEREVIELAVSVISTADGDDDIHDLIDELISWNDLRHRTSAEVITLFRAAAQGARS